MLKISPGGKTFNATTFGHDCIQFVGLRLPADSPSTDHDEDCLLLNVFRPSGVNVSSQLPVMVWVYGGGFARAYDSDSQAVRQYIDVLVNY